MLSMGRGGGQRPLPDLGTEKKERRKSPQLLFLWRGLPIPVVVGKLVAGVHQPLPHQAPFLLPASDDPGSAHASRKGRRSGMRRLTG